VPCPHAGFQVEGRCYWCCKKASTNGHRDKLSAEQLGFVGFMVENEHGQPPTAARPARHWLEVVTPSTIDRQLEELARLRDLAPGYLALARRILE
jgi:hypothetical protein